MIKKIIPIALISLTLLGTSCTLKSHDEKKPLVQETVVQKKEKNVKDLYGYKNVYLKNFYDLEFEDANKKYDMPYDLEGIIEGSSFFKSRIRISNPERFKKKVLEITENLSYAEEDISNLTPEESLNLAALVVAENYDFKLVNYEGKSIDEIFEIGKAKCTDYTLSVIAVFNLFKEMNPSLKNVYVVDHHFCRYIGHAWNTIIILGNGGIQVSYMDSTWYDTKDAEDLNATDKWHIDFEKWRSQFYEELRDYSSAQKELQPLIEKTTDKKRLEELLDNSARYYYWGKDYKNSLRVYKELVEKFPDSKRMDKYVYQMGWVYYELKDYKHVKECIGILKTKYPHSTYKLDYLEKFIEMLETK